MKFHTSVQYFMLFLLPEMPFLSSCALTKPPEVTPLRDLMPLCSSPYSLRHNEVFLPSPFKAHCIYFYSSTYYRVWWPGPAWNHHLWPRPFVTLQCWSAEGNWEHHGLALPSPLDFHFPLTSPALSKSPFPSRGSFNLIPSQWLWL